MKNTYIEKGLLYFNALKEKNLQIVTTFDNEVWGNMNPTFAKDDSERELLKVKDSKLAEIVGYKTSFSLTTPNEDSMIDFDKKSLRYMNSLYPANENGYKDILIATNCMLVYPQEERYGYIVAPRDCAVVVITPPNHSFALIMHIGAPQLLTGLHRKAIKMLDEQKESFDSLEMYITPYIHKDNYSVSLEKGERYRALYGEDFDKYAEIRFSDIWRTERYFVDFMGAFKDEMKKSYGVSNIIDSGIDNYEEAQKGFLYSYKYDQELVMRRERGEDISDGEIEKHHKGFNVVVGI